jgi:hypothetical protein
MAKVSAKRADACPFGNTRAMRFGFFVKNCGPFQGAMQIRKRARAPAPDFVQKGRMKYVKAVRRALHLAGGA